jgi:hypothetical protein
MQLTCVQFAPCMRAEGAMHQESSRKARTCVRIGSQHCQKGINAKDARIYCTGQYRVSMTGAGGEEG